MLDVDADDDPSLDPLRVRALVAALVVVVGLANRPAV